MTMVARPVRSHHRPALACGAAVALVAGLLAGCTEPEPEPSSSPTDTASPTPSQTPTEEPTPTPAAEEVSVYFMIDTPRSGLRLVREKHDVPGGTVEAAVEQMVAGPDDPDYVSPWNPATEVRGVTLGATVVVDLSADARTANIGSAGAALMIQQLVYTVTSAAGDDLAAVMLTIEGEPAGELWGAVEWTQPVVREDPLNVQALVQVDVPREGATTTSPVTVSGEAAAFEANVPWKVLDAAGAEVTSGFTMTSEGQTFAPYSFTIDLAPGEYTIVLTEDDPSDGAGGIPMSNTRTVTVG